MRALLIFSFILGGCTQTAFEDLDQALAAERLAPETEESILAQLAQRRLQSTVPPGDLRRLALIVEPLAREPVVEPSLQAVALPSTIRVWRRGLDGSTVSCSGRVDTINFEEYVKGVLPHEWITSWDSESLKAGAVVIRTYAWYWVKAGGKYDCADIDDTTASQVYKDARVAKASAAADATRGEVVITATGGPVFAEYSAENSDPTKDGVSEPHCTGKALYGHGRGMCQWGSQRWALAGKGYAWMVSHYYPGKTLAGAGPSFAAKYFKMQPPPATMKPGEEAVVWFEYVNDGLTAWDNKNTRVGTTGPRDRASAFKKDGNWLNDARPTAVDQLTAPGETGRFSFVVKAPDVAEDTELTESFGLVQEGVTWFGPADDIVSFTILVVAGDKGAVGGGGGVVDPPGDGTQMGASGGAGGCSMAPGRGPSMLWVVMIGAAFVRARRRKRC